eukprot:TRINITY_DN6366_c0_g1_i1.p1 TRINITY_DN6366_c0_g1~~TRINITY_DN6366_c0_g1_i1.p1  ORF type:complete len:352 (-),score=67.00 TRINITY_DN6366_c0_g1_i1:7-1038(-)
MDPRALAPLLQRFPRAEFAMAYGSGVLPQAGYGAASPPTVDLVLGVADAREWHRRNMRRNAAHYPSCALIGGPRFAAWLQSLGAGMYYIADVAMNVRGALRPVKYGVVSLARLQSDLRHWDSLYVSGRMQKPFVTLRPNELVSRANDKNVANAVKATLLLLPQAFTEDTFLTTYTNLSYMGDVRLTVGAENPNKAANIVSKQRDLFRQHFKAYPSALQVLSTVTDYGGRLRKAGGPGKQLVVEQDVSTSTRVELFRGLPKRFLGRMTARCGDRPDGVIRAWVESGRHQDVLRRAIAAVVFASSTTQAAKGLLTTGVSRSLCYARAKLRKAAEQRAGKKRRLDT